MATDYKGRIDVHETWESGALTYADTQEKTFVLHGKLEDVEKKMRLRGAEYQPGWIVVSSTLTPEHGGMARMVIACRRKKPSAGGSAAEDDDTGDTEPDKIIEVSMAQLEKPLMAKDEWKGYGPQIAMWQESPANLRAQYKYLDGEAEHTLTGGAADVAELLMRGVESYLCFAPVVRVQTTTTDAPSNVGKDTGKRCNPPQEATSMLSGTTAWDWLKTGDTVTLNADGSYTRSEEWTGADQWETLLYEDG